MLSVHLLNVFSLSEGTLVATQSLLGELVDALVGGTSSSLDHIKNASLVGTQSNNLTRNGTAKLGSL